jgi:DNA polymerase-3 subunit beta
MSQAMQKSEFYMAESLSFTIGRAELLKSLSHVQSVVEKRGTIPILSHIKMDVADGFVTLTATDMEIAVVDKVPADVMSNGAVTLPAHMLYDIVRKIADDADIQMVEDKAAQKVAITAGNAKFALATLPVDDFPAIASGELPHSFSITKEECRVLIEKTRFAMSSEETRYYLNGVYLHEAQHDGAPVLRAVATDGHRLSRVDVPFPAGAAGMTGVIIPRKTIGEVSKLLEDSVNDIQISISNSKIRFVFGNTVLFSKLVDGTFPDYMRVIPASNDIMLEVGAVTLAKAVDRVSVISSDKVRGVKLSLEKGAITITTPSSDQNQGEERIEARYDGEPLAIGFNARYLMDVLAQIEGTTVRFMVNNTGGASLAVDPQDDSVIYVIMPMRV